MWSKLRKKVLKPNKKFEGETDDDGDIILKKVDKIPSYVFEPDGSTGRESRPGDWQMALSLDSPPQAFDSPLPVPHHSQRPLSTFGVSYSPQLTPKRCNSIKEDNSAFFGLDLEGQSSPSSQCDNKHTPVHQAYTDFSQNYNGRAISVHNQDTFIRLKKDLALAETQDVNLVNGNASPDEIQNSAGQSSSSPANTITVSMGITLSMSAMKNLAPIPPPKKDKKYERVVTTEQVRQEQLTSPLRRKRSDLPPVVISERGLLDNVADSIPQSPMRTLSTGSGQDQAMLSEPSTATSQTSDSVFELELQFERQESGYATLDDAHDKPDKFSFESREFSPLDFGCRDVEGRVIGSRLSPSPNSTGTSLQTVDVLKGVIPNSAKDNPKPPNKPERIYPTFRKQLSSGNNNTSPVPMTNAAEAVITATTPTAAAKPEAVDINQNLRSGNCEARSSRDNQQRGASVEPDVTMHTTESGVEQRPTGVDLTRVLRDKVEYVPADSSMSSVFRRKDHRSSTDGDTGSSLEDLYASIPKGIQRVSTDEGAMTGTSGSERSSRADDDLEGSIAGSEATEKTDETSGTVVGSEYNTDEEVLDDGIDVDGGSEDSEAVPPIPEKNYRLLTEGTIMREAASWKKTSPEHSVSDEPTHMSWDEVMNEARTLGIPWKKPQLQIATKPSETSPESEQPPHRESVTSLEIPQSPTSPTSPSPVCEPRTLSLHLDDKHERKKSPFKEKFKFQSLFSKKKDKGDKNHHDNHHHNNSKYHTVSSHKRGLPTPPPGGSSCTLCSSPTPRSSRTSLLSVPKSPAANHHNRVGATWGSSSSIQSQQLSLSCSSASLASSLSPGYGAHHFMSMSMTASIPQSAVYDLQSPTSGARRSNADFIDSLRKLKDSGWYWGPMSWDEAEAKLANKPDGSFLVRDSSDDRYILSLSFRSQSATHHTRIEHYKGMFSFYSQPKSHGAATIVEFIEKAMEHSRSGKFLYFLRPRAPGYPPAPVQLLFPVSRFRNMHTLQHLCRFEILKHTRKDLIDRLPIPPRLKEYLKQSQYYTECYSEEFREHPLFAHAY